jgi:hypothetical protein
VSLPGALLLAHLSTRVQDFARECVDQKNGARVKGMPQQITTRGALTEILISIIFIAGPQHGAINFGQYENMAYVPNMPLSIYQDYQLLSEQEAPITEEQLLKVCVFIGSGPHLLRGLVSMTLACLWHKEACSCRVDDQGSAMCQFACCDPCVAGKAHLLTTRS